MDACEAYARRWAKKEGVELDTLSEWIKSIGDVLKHRIRRLLKTFRQHQTPKAGKKSVARPKKQNKKAFNINFALLPINLL